MLDIVCKSKSAERRAQLEVSSWRMCSWKHGWLGELVDLGEFAELRRGASEQIFYRNFLDQHCSAATSLSPTYHLHCVVEVISLSLALQLPTAIYPI